MLRSITFLLLTPCLFLFTACPTEETYELATSPETFIELEMDGETILLNSRPSVTSNYLYTEWGQDGLHLEHSTPDNRRAVFLNLTGCNLVNTKTARTLATGAAAGDCSTEASTVTIGYTAFVQETRGACPHIAGVPTELDGTINIESWTEDGHVSGTFETFADEEHDYVLKGRFQSRL